MFLSLLFHHYSVKQGSTRPLVVKFADSKKQGKGKDDNVGMGDTVNTSLGIGAVPAPAQVSLTKPQAPDFWVKQYQLQQQQQMMYTYGVTQQQVQQQLFSTQNVPVMAYGATQSQQNQPQQYVYMQQAAPNQYYSTTPSGSSYVRSDGADFEQQMSRITQQQQQQMSRQVQQLTSDGANNTIYQLFPSKILTPSPAAIRDAEASGCVRPDC